MKRIIFTFIVVIAVLLPIWPYSQIWGFPPSLGVFTLGLILMALRLCRAI